MTRLILVATAQTDWRVQGRLSGDTDLPLNQVGHEQAVADGGALAALAPTLCRCGSEQATKQTAGIIAHELGIRFRTIKELREVDLGHWEGLTLDEFRDRFPKVHRQWRAEPTSVEPPEGESVPTAASRLAGGLQKIVKRHPTDVIAIVVGPLAYAILRCRLQDGHYERFWEYADSDERRCDLTIEPATITAP
jgi:broad specificity phosphatase PhoE